MANREDLEKLCQGPKVWNAWRAEQPDYNPDLRNLSLTLSQRQLGPTNGGPINLADADLDSAELRDATLSHADLRYARLSAADLTHARLDNADLTGADLTDAILDHADLTDAKLHGTILTGTSLSEVRGLTADQLAFARGDATTVLPSTLQPPREWFAAMEGEDFEGDIPPEPFHEMDLYGVLGVGRNATADEIRASFRSLVKKLHPDINPGDAAAQEAFKQVSAAYRILNDPDKRARYDRGEIGSDGEVTAEYEARKHFRRYAFRFYMAAAASLMLAVGVLAGVWYMVLTEQSAQERGRLEIAVATPPKSSERLGSGAETPPAPSALAPSPEKANVEAAKSSADPAESALAKPPSEEAEAAADARPPEKANDADEGRAGETERIAALSGDEAPNADASARIEAGSRAPAPVIPPSEAAKADHQKQEARGGEEAGTGGESLNQKDGEPETRSAALPQAAEDRPPSKNSDAGDGGPPDAKAGAEPIPLAALDRAGDKNRPLEESHSEKEARPAEADAARSGAPAENSSEGEDQTEKDGGQPQNEATGQEQQAVAAEDGQKGPHSAILVPRTEGRKGARDSISDLFRRRAVKNALGANGAQATASVDPHKTEKPIAAEEVWDLYTHSLPGADESEQRPWPKTPKSARPARRALSPVPAVEPASQNVTAKIPEREPSSEAKQRKQAVSDILAGGL